MDVLVGRQPIFGRNLEVYGYELLYRDAGGRGPTDQDPDAQTSRVILGACTEIGLERIVGSRRAFINLTQGFVLGRVALPLAPDRVVLEVLEAVPPTPEVLDGLRDLARRGYVIALDDYALEPERRPLLDVAHIVKVELPAVHASALEPVVTELQERGLEVLAEKIETQDEYERCREAGFDLFQGYFLSRPHLIQGRVMPTNRLSLVRLLARLVDATCDVDEVCNLVQQDVVLSYRLLRHINSALYGLREPVGSVREAVVYLGLAKVRNLASLFLLAAVDDKPTELLNTAMIRGRMAELLVERSGGGRPDTGFTVGLFSALDALLDTPMEQLLLRLPLVREVAEALLHRGGRYGDVLECVLAYERGEWERVRCGSLNAIGIRDAFLAAVDWAGVAREEIRSAA